MAKVLSQEEVDSLLNGIGEGSVETETNIPTNSDELKLYDFKSKTGPNHLRMPAMGIINERFVSFINPSLSAAAGTLIDINVTDVDSVRYGDYCRSLPLPTSLNIFKMEPLRGFALLVLEGALVFGFVDTFFGGNCGGHVKLEGRGFTPIETRIIQRIVGIVLEDYQKAWADVYQTRIKYARSEADPQFAGIAKPDDMVIANKFSVDIGNFSGAMTICVPYTTLEPIKNVLRESYKSEQYEVDHAWRKQFEEKIKEQFLTLDCVLGSTVVTGRDLLGMKPDDVIMLDQKISDSIQVSIGGILKFRGYPGTYNNKKAVRIEKKILVG